MKWCNLSAYNMPDRIIKTVQKRRPTTNFVAIGQYSRASIFMSIGCELMIVQGGISLRRYLLEKKWNSEILEMSG